MVSFSTRFRYFGHKLLYFASAGRKSHLSGQMTHEQAIDRVWKHVFQERLTYLHWNKGPEMAPTIGEAWATLLVRKLPTMVGEPMPANVGDVVVLRDPGNSDNYLVRRVVGTSGNEMVSTDEKDEPFVLQNECWVLADNEKLKPKEANDSRTFGPVPVSDIAGRAIYCLRTPVDHGPVQNSHLSMHRDWPVLEVELDVGELAKNHKT